MGKRAEQEVIEELIDTLTNAIMADDQKTALKAAKKLAVGFILDVRMIAGSLQKIAADTDRTIINQVHKGR